MPEKSQKKIILDNTKGKQIYYLFLNECNAIRLTDQVICRADVVSKIVTKKGRVDEVNYMYRESFKKISRLS